MTLLAEVTHVGSPAATGSDIVSLDSGIWSGEAGKFVLSFSYAQSGAQIRAHSALGVGAAVSAASQASTAIYSQNNVPTSVARRAHDDANYIYNISNQGLPQLLADFVSFGANQFTRNFSTTTSGWVVNHLVLGGDIDVHHQRIVSPATIGPQSYTGIGFQPTALLAFGVNLTSLPPDTNLNSSLTFGMSDGVTDSCVTATSENAVPTSNTQRLLLPKLYSGLSISTASEIIGCTVQSLDSDGYTLDWSPTISGVNLSVFALGGVSAKVIVGDSPLTNTSVTRNVGFPPVCGVTATCMSPSSSNVEGNWRVGIGAWDSHGNQSFSGSVDENGLPTTNADRVQSAINALQLIEHQTNTVGSAAVSAVGDDIEEAWTSTDGTAREVSHLVLGEASAPPDEDVLWPAQQIVSVL